MTFTAGNLFLSHSCIAVTQVRPPLGFEPMSPAWEVDDLPAELSLPPYAHFSFIGFIDGITAHTVNLTVLKILTYFSFKGY